MSPGISVSRVGGSAQTPFMKKDLWRYQDGFGPVPRVGGFRPVRFDLDDATRRQLEHGARVTELMKQKQFAPMSVAEMGTVLFAANEGYLTDVEVEKVLDFTKLRYSGSSTTATQSSLPTLMKLAPITTT